MKKLLAFLLLLSACHAPTEEIPACDHADAVKFLHENVIQFGTDSIADNIKLSDIQEQEVDATNKTRHCAARLEYDWPGRDTPLILSAEYSLHYLNPSNRTNLFTEVMNVTIP